MNCKVVVLFLVAVACSKAPSGSVGGSEPSVEGPGAATVPSAASAEPAVAPPGAVSAAVVPEGIKASVTAGFAAIAAGRFQMGVPDSPGAYNDAPLHPVVVSRAFELMTSEVTLKQYGEIMATSGDQQSTCKDCPVAMVSWYQAASYCNELSKRQGLAQCYRIDGFAVTWPEGLACSGYRLPTEAEWEYAARAGSSDVAPKNVEEYAWFDENSQLKPHPIKGKIANGFGLFDMLGNAGEWVWDWQGEYPRETVADPTGPKGGDNRVFRGGNFRYGSGEASYGFRSAYGPPVRVEYIGFRCARTLPK